MPGMIVNFRGCGDITGTYSNANNHALILVNSNGQQITFTPHHNFYDRAHFGCNIRDGKQKGSFVVFTINVKRGTM